MKKKNLMTRLLVSIVMLAVLPAKGGKKIYVYPRTEHPIDMAVYAVDEWGKSVAGEPVKVWYIREDKPFAKWGELNGITDTNGYFRVRGTPGGPTFVCSFCRNDDNYYNSSVSDYQIEGGFKDGLVITGVVRKVGNPIKMWGGDVNVSVKGNTEPIVLGIDLMKGELMPPDGKGSVTDAVIRVTTFLEEDTTNGKRKPVKVNVTLEMVDKQGGFIKAPYYPSCYYDTTREAPAEGAYSPVLSCDLNVKADIAVDKDLANCKKGKRHAIFRVFRESKSNSAEKHALFGLVYCANFQVSWSGVWGYGWSFHMPIFVNGRPGDRNLERFTPMYLRKNWYEANFDRIEETPIPEVLK